MSGEVIVDALPYTDVGYDEPGVKQAAISLVEEECRRFKPNKNYLDFLGPVNLHAFETEILKNEFQRMENRLPMEMLSMKRYELPPPPQNKQADAAAWFECVENSYAQLEHQASRIVNLEIMAEYGPNAWRLYIQTLKSMFEQTEKQLDAIRKQIQAVNLGRKTEQVGAGIRLRALEQSWIGLVSKNYEIECAVVELEKELLEIKKRKTAENATNAIEEAEERSVERRDENMNVEENAPASVGSTSSEGSSEENKSSGSEEKEDGSSPMESEAKTDEAEKHEPTEATNKDSENSNINDESMTQN